MRYYVSSASACADPGIFTKWGGGGGGGVEGPGPPDSKKLGQRFLLFLLFLVLTFNLFNSFYRGDRSQGQMVYFLENNNFPRFQRRPTFYGVGEGSNFFPGWGASKC